MGCGVLKDYEFIWSSVEIHHTFSVSYKNLFPKAILIFIMIRVKLSEDTEISKEDWNIDKIGDLYGVRDTS